ncbi:MAG: alpha-amylase/4-alpha-glucanotransferase domain-containing protein [Treponema sp.]
MNTPKKTVHFCFCAQLSISHIQKTDKSAVLPNFKAFFSGIHAIEKLPLTLYTAGSFLEWQKEKRQGYAMLISEMLARKQIEVLAGGYYQPYLAMLPVSDIIGQLELMTTAIRTHYDKRVRGLFLTGSAWLPSLITPITKCGMEYCLLDSRLFPENQASAAAGSSRFTPVMLEDNGKTITAFPYIWGDPDIMQQPPEHFYTKITEAAPAGCESVCLLFLPIDTYVKGLEKNKTGSSWFSSFVELCASPQSEIKLTHTAAVMKQKKIPPLAYIPPNMIYADAPAGASVKQIVTMNRPAFLLYAKMMYVHVLANGVKGDKSRKKYALQEFWKGQSAEFFTLNSRSEPYRCLLRRAAYRNLLVAEKQTRMEGVFADGLIRYDIDLDGLKEFLSQRRFLNMYVHNRGGKIFECDVFSSYKNYCDMPLEHSGMFTDYLVSADILEALKREQTDTLTDIFSQNLYQETECDTIRSELKFSAVGYFDSIKQPVLLRKQYTFFDEGTQVQYILKNDSPFNLSTYFMVELDIALEQTGSEEPFLLVYDGVSKRKCRVSAATFQDISWIQLTEPDGNVQFTMEANEVPDIITVPVWEEYPLQAGTRHIRGVRLFFYWKVELSPGYETEKMFFLKITASKDS